MLNRKEALPLRRVARRGGRVSATALLCLGVPTNLAAQSAAPAQVAQAGSAVTPLPTVSVDITKPRRKPKRAAPQRAPAPPAPAAPGKPPDTQEARTGTVGVYADSTPVATRTNAPLINIPQIGRAHV